MTPGDLPLRGFLFMKALIARYGVERTAELDVLADRLVAQGVAPSFMDAVEMIETNMGLPVTPRPDG